MGWPAELIFVIVLIIITIAIYIWGIYHPFNKYKKAEEFSGTVLMEIEPSKKEKIFRNLSLLFCIVLCLGLYLKEYLDKGIWNISHIIILLGAFFASILHFKNQKICEKGILISTGLVEWKNIESIEPIDEMSDKIKIRLKKRMNGARKITLYCMSEEALNIVRLIEGGRMRENNDFQIER